MEEVLLLFDSLHPCWSKKTVALEGEDPEILEALEQRGLLERILKEEGDLFLLTSRGRAHHGEMTKQYFIPCLPGISPEDPERAHGRTLLELLLNRSFQGRWGIKEFRPGEALKYAPNLEGSALWEECKEGFRWLYPEHFQVRALKEGWPLPRKVPQGDYSREERWNAWIRQQGLSHATLELDLLFLHHYDSEHFQHLSPPPGDIHGLFHTDRFYFQFLPWQKEIPKGSGRSWGNFSSG